MSCRACAKRDVLSKTLSYLYQTQTVLVRTMWDEKLPLPACMDAREAGGRQQDPVVLQETLGLNKVKATEGSGHASTTRQSRGFA